MFLTGSYNDDLVLTGGFSNHYCTRCSSASSEDNVAVWSMSGNSANTGPPQFEQECQYEGECC